MLRVAIIGCGKISDAHAAQIQRIHDCEIVATCDREPLMAAQLADRFGIKQSFSDLSDLLTDARPDVVHVVTPPASHFAIAKACLEAGSHVYVEKPFTLNFSDAKRLVDLANQKHVKLTAGHNCQFTHAARRMRDLVRTGYLGAGPVHMESIWGYDLGDASYARALLGDKQHWVRKLPGRLLHNILSHGVARISEFLETDNPEVIAHGFVSPLLRSIGETGIIDELRVIIADEGQTTAYFTFSSQMKPCIHEFRIFGSANGLVLDQDHEIVLHLRGAKFKSFADKFIPPVLFACQYAGELTGNIRRFLGRDFHEDTGIKYLTEAFYRSIREDTPLPIPYREILLTARIMDSIFEQLPAHQPVAPVDVPSTPVAV